MNQDAIDRLCERISATAGGTDCLLERDVRAALEGERDRSEKLRRVLIAVVETQGIDHDEEDCPEDDTCRCENIRLANEALTETAGAL